MNGEKPFVHRPPTYTIFFKYWLPPLSYAALIFYLSSLPGTAYPPLFFSADILLHLGEYALLGFLLARALGYSRPSRTLLFSSTVVLCTLYGVSDELHQLFVPSRCASVIDALADGIGSSLGAGIYLRQRRKND